MSEVGGMIPGGIPGADGGGSIGSLPGGYSAPLN